MYTKAANKGNKAASLPNPQGAPRGVGSGNPQSGPRRGRPEEGTIPTPSVFLNRAQAYALVTCRLDATSPRSEGWDIALRSLWALGLAEGPGSSAINAWNFVTRCSAYSLRLSN